MNISTVMLIITVVVCVAFIVAINIFGVIPTFIFFGIMATLGAFWTGLIFAFMAVTNKS